MSYNSSRQKRPSEPSSRFQPSSSSSNKKPKFDHRNPSTLAPESLDDEDSILDLDPVGRTGQQTKRNAVNLDGFESDSSSENFDIRAAERNKAADDDVEDMFTDEPVETLGREDVPEAGRKKKQVSFIETAQIEGQEEDSTSGGHVRADMHTATTADGVGKGPQRGKRRATSPASESEDEEDEEEEEGEGKVIDEDDDEGLDKAELGATSKKTHAPRLDAFNMQKEGDEGRFDSSGNFVRNAVDPEAVHDGWLDGVKKRDMKRAKEAEEKREEERRKKEREDDGVGDRELLRDLIMVLEKGETGFEALVRLGSKKEKKKKIKQKRSGDMDVDVDGDENGKNGAKEGHDEVENIRKEKIRKESIEKLTAAADRLMSRGQLDVYELERESLTRQFKKVTGDDWEDLDGNTAADENDDRDWEYRWSDGRNGGDIHGPYDTKTMHAWKDAGYFGESVEFRRVGTHEWMRVLESA